MEPFPSETSHQHNLVALELGLVEFVWKVRTNFVHNSASRNRLMKQYMPQDLKHFGDPESKEFDTLIVEIGTQGFDYSVDTYASDYQFGAALLQTDLNGERKPLGYL